MEQIYAGRNHSMAITSITNQVFTWGDGSCGQLGYNRKVSGDPTIVEQLLNKEIIKGCLGVDNSAVINKNGDVYLWGGNTSNKLGLNRKTMYEATPLMSPTLKNIKTISLGLEHSGAINNKGELFMWGSNLYGQLGLSHFNSVDVPTKSTSNIIFSKVKCGSYQTLFMDIDKLVYVSGKARLNLSSEEDKHKATINLIEDMKGDKLGKKIQAGLGNSIILTEGNDIYAFGKNEYSKAGGELNDEFVMKNPRPIIIETSNKKKVNICKVFANYDHCFTISYMGDIYAWGNPRLFRLTGSFGDEISKVPKGIEIEWNHKGTENNNQEKDDYDDNNKDEKFKFQNNLDERQILVVLNKSLKIFSFKEIYSIIKKIGKKFDDTELINRDSSILDELFKLFSELTSIFNEELDKIKHYYMEVDQLTTIRIKEINAPILKDKVINSNIPREIINYTDEIEKIYSFLFIHPCVIQNLLENITTEESTIVINGISPMYIGLDNKQHKYESFLAQNLIALFRICIDQDYIAYRNDIDYFCAFNQVPVIELIAKRFLYNNFSKCILLDILKQSFIGIRDIAISPRELNNPTNLGKLYKVIQDSYDRLYYIDISHVSEIFELTKLILLDFENNYSKLPDCFIYCLRYFKKHINKDQMTSYSKDKKFIKMKLLSCTMRFLYSNVIGKMLTKLFDDETNRILICRSLNINIDSTNRLILEFYLKIVGALFERIACNEIYTLKEFKREEDEDEIDEPDNNMNRVLNQLNNFIQDTHNKLFISFVRNFPKLNYNFKTNYISSLVYNNLSLKPHKISIDLTSLVEFFKFLKNKQSRFCGEMQYTIFESITEFELEEEQKKKIMKLTLDYKYLRKPLDFSLKYEKEIEVNNKAIMLRLSKSAFEKCIKCSCILPSVFFKNESSTTKIFGQLAIKSAKINKPFFIYYSKILLHKHFKPNNIATLKDILSSLKYTKKKLEEDFCTELDEYIYLNELELLIQEIDYNKKSEEEKMRIFVNELHNHIRNKIHHYYKIESYSQLLADIKDIIHTTIEFQSGFRKDLIECKGNLKLFSNSLEYEEDKDLYEAQLKHKILNKPIYTNDNIFRYKPNNYTIKILKKNLVLLLYDKMNFKEKHVFLQISSNSEKKYFDFKLRHQKTKEYILFFKF
jgi:alpha-tubulin suppressor-like RCC1 family protein